MVGNTSLLFKKIWEILGHGSYQNVQTGCFKQSDLIGDGKRCEAWQLLSKLHRLYDALGGEFAELVPQIYVQGYTSF